MMMVVVVCKFFFLVIVQSFFVGYNRYYVTAIERLCMILHVCVRACMRVRLCVCMCLFMIYMNKQVHQTFIYSDIDLCANQFANYNRLYSKMQLNILGRNY